MLEEEVEESDEPGEKASCSRCTESGILREDAMELSADCWPNMQEALGSSPALYKLGVLVQA